VVILVEMVAAYDFQNAAVEWKPCYSQDFVLQQNLAADPDCSALVTNLASVVCLRGPVRQEFQLVGLSQQYPLATVYEVALVLTMQTPYQRKSLQTMEYLLNYNVH
jgi:hypothetical protein